LLMLLQNENNLHSQNQEAVIWARNNLSYRSHKESHLYTLKQETDLWATSIVAGLTKKLSLHHTEKTVVLPSHYFAVTSPVLDSLTEGNYWLGGMYFQPLTNLII
jgi:hypothetical protein